MIKKQFQLVSFVSLAFLSFNISGADFYTFANPSKLSVMNSYEQPLSDSEKKALPSGFPLEIINNKQTLGDQITDAIKCENNEETYFLMRTENGSFTNSQNVSFEKHSGCTSLWDTVELTSPVTLSGKTSLSLSKGTSVIRVFQKNGSTYLFAFDRNAYGMVQSTTVFRKAAKVEKKAVLVTTSNISETIKRRFESVNEQYKSVFGFLNGHTNQQKSVPYWEIETDGNSIICKLKGSKQTIAQLETSTGYIVRDIERFLLSKPYRSSYSNYEIKISVKQ